MPKYFKNTRMQQLFSELEIEVTKENTDKIDEVIHAATSLNAAGCFDFSRNRYQLYKTRLDIRPAGINGLRA